MGKTRLTIEEDKFLINGRLVYSEYGNMDYHGLLMNARFIQGIFDETEDRRRFDRFGKNFDPDKNTEDLIDALPAWYEKGLRAITVGFQGGGPCFTTDNSEMTNNPYKRDRDQMVIDQAYQDRMLRIILAADDLGMVVIVSGFYPGQVRNLKDGFEVVESVRAVCRFINETGCENIIYEICNEYDLCRDHPMIGTGQGMATLIKLAKEALDKDIPVGSSLTGGSMNEEVAAASDLVLIHGNGCSRQKYYNLIQRTKEAAGNKPVLCNEDSQAIGNMVVSMKEGVSWGYYNNMTKQEPPTDWGITEGEDQFFAERMAIELGIEEDDESRTKADRYFLQGLETGQKSQGLRWVRLASLYPETIDKVIFYNNDCKIYTAYDEPFMVNFETNWLQKGLETRKKDVIRAEIHLVSGEVIIKEAVEFLD